MKFLQGIVGCLATTVSLIASNASAAWQTITLKCDDKNGMTCTDSSAQLLKGVTYGTSGAVTPAASLQKLDIYRPSGTPPAGGFPVIVWVHGGGYTGSNPNDCPAATRTFDTDRDGTVSVKEDWAAVLRQVTRGFAVVSVDYRTPSTNLHRDDLRHDVQQAIRFVKARGQNSIYGYDSSRHSINRSSSSPQRAPQRRPCRSTTSLCNRPPISLQLIQGTAAPRCPRDAVLRETAMAGHSGHVALG